MNVIANELLERLSKNDINSKSDFKQELREITQELVMAGLSTTDFFYKSCISWRNIFKIDI